ncbi:MAG: transposase [Candidatus Saliniplasma sp.]
MGCTHRRMNLKVVQQANREIDSLFIEHLSRALKKLDRPWKKSDTGRPTHSAEVVTFCCVMKIATCRTYDEIESYVELISEKIRKKFHVSRVPRHSVIHCGMKRLRMIFIRKLIRLIILYYRREGMSISIDSSGFSTSNSSKWFDVRIKKKNFRSEYLKLHIAVDVETGIIHHFTITPGEKHDSPEFERLMKELPQVDEVMADKAYTSRKNCRIVADKNGVPFLHFRENATSSAKGKPAWKISYYQYIDNEEEWIESYHQQKSLKQFFHQSNNGRTILSF